MQKSHPSKDCTCPKSDVPMTLHYQLYSTPFTQTVHCLKSISTIMKTWPYHQIDTFHCQ